MSEIVLAARQWLGTPYRHRAATLGAGCDCLGLIRGIWRQLHGSEPVAVPPYGASYRDRAHIDGLWQAAETLLVREGELAPGRVLVFRLHRSLPPRHCGVLVAPDRFIHSQERLGVVEAPLSDGWRQRIAGIFSFPHKD